MAVYYSRTIKRNSVKILQRSSKSFVIIINGWIKSSKCKTNRHTTEKTAFKNKTGTT